MSVANPDREIRKWGGAHPDPEMRGGGSLEKSFFWPFGPHFRRKIRGAQAPGPLPLSVSVVAVVSVVIVSGESRPSGKGGRSSRP